ncbi:MAG: polysaccharide biosynthesis protein [Lachnospiraceae bacterium]|nr:polysaccharide biosynthesis protein [Lachnospiraceae bacterium]
MSQNTMTKRKNSFLMQGSILALAGIVTKFIGFIYRIPMTNLLGDQGNGIYSVAFGIYNIALTLSSYSLPLAVSKLVSARLAKREYHNAWRIFQDALIFAVLAGTVACLALFFGADALEELYAREGLAKPLRILAPTTFVVALLGVFRGYFQGKGTMMPTAFSQIAEQIINAVVSVVAAWQFIHIYKNTAEEAAYGAAGGTLGTLAGALTALLFLVFVFMAYFPTIKKQNARDHSEQESHAQLYGVLLLTIFPVILSQTIYQIGYTIDDFLFGNLMAEGGVADQVISSQQGVFNTQYNLLINLPVAIATSMAASTIPSIVSSGVQGKRKERNDKIRVVVKLNMAIAFPSAVGLALLSRPIITLLFPSLMTYRDVAVNLLLTGSSAVIFYALSTITGAVLQGGNFMRIPVIHSGISLTVHVALVYSLLKYTELGVYALIIGNVTFPLLVSLLNCISVHRKMGYRWEMKKTFLLPLAASGLMGIVIFLMNMLIQMLFSMWEGMEKLGNLVALLIAGGLGVFVYGAVLLGTRCFSNEEMKGLPLLRKLAK